MKKVGLVLLVLIMVLTGVLTSGCDDSFKSAKTEGWAEGHLRYIHDDVHDVGIWVIDSQGKLGGRHIFVLPDSEYSNPGKHWPER